MSELQKEIKETVELSINNKPVQCEAVDFNILNFTEKNPDLEWIIKTEPVKVTIAKGGEEIGTEQDGIKPRTTKAGQFIIQNKPDAEKPEDPYIFGDGDKTVSEQIVEFANKYEAVFGRSGYFRKKAVPMAVIRVKNPTAIQPSWDPENWMGTPAGGVIASEGYTINPKSLEESYAFVTKEGKAIKTNPQAKK